MWRLACQADLPCTAAFLLPTQDLSPEDLTADDASPASAVRQRYEKLFKERQRAAETGTPKGADAAAARATANLQARMAFQGIISSVFMKFLR